MYTIYLHILTAMVFAAFFSGVETAFASASKMRFQLDTHRQGLISKLLALYYRHPDDFVTALLTGYNLSLVVYGILVAQAVESWLPDGHGISRHPPAHRNCDSGMCHAHHRGVPSQDRVPHQPQPDHDRLRPSDVPALRGALSPGQGTVIARTRTAPADR